MPERHLVPMYLVIDTETTGVPHDWSAPISHLGNWPRLVQFAWALLDGEEKVLERAAHVVRPEGFTIPRAAERIHGISTQRALVEGLPLHQVLEEFSAVTKKAAMVVAHNLAFDAKVVGAEYLRARLPNPLRWQRRLCTMLAGTDVCQLPGRDGYKWPTLPELYAALFHAPYTEIHEAAADVAACARCFFELKRRGVIGPQP